MAVIDLAKRRVVAQGGHMVSIPFEGVGSLTAGRKQPEVGAFGGLINKINGQYSGKSSR
jgi:hypothetical protein